METKYFRMCPACNTEIIYKTKRNRNDAEIKNTRCKMCVFNSSEISKRDQRGINGNFYGKKHSDESKKKMHINHGDRPQNHSGSQNGFYGKKHTQTTKDKISKSRRTIVSKPQKIYYGKGWRGWFFDRHF